MATTFELKTLAQIAQAAYAVFPAGTSTPQLISALQERDGAFTLTQATRFAAEQSVVLQYNDDAGAGAQGTSLSATVFKDTYGNLTLAIRGTLEAIGDLTPTDVPYIAAYGVAYDQIAALHSWWLRASAIAGTLVPQYRLSQTNEGQPDAVSVPGGYLLRAADALASGELTAAMAGDGDGRIDVTGHSLGGHLAMAFAAIFPTVTASVTAFNAPGFRDTTDNRAYFQRLGGTLPDQSSIGPKTTNVVANHTSQSDVPWQGIAMLHSRPGTAVDCPIENQAQAGEPDKPSARNHSQMVLADALAVYDVLDRLQPGLSAASFGRLLAGSSNTEYQGLEFVMGSIQTLLGISNSALPTGNGVEAREALYLALDSLQSHPAFQSLAGKVRIDPSSNELAARARNDFSALASLLTLSPVVLTATSAANQTVLDETLRNAWGQTYLDWEADRDMAQAGRDAGKETFTDKWIADRSRLINAVMLQNQRNSTSGLALDNTVPSDRVYEFQYYGGTPRPGETQPPLQTLLAASRSGVLPRQLIAVGDETNNQVSGTDNQLGDHLYGAAGSDVLNGQGGADRLEGNTGNDTVNGGAGADTLLGQAGDDTLEGGPDNDTLLGGQDTDTYFFTAGWGHDTIEDSDGQGSLRVPGYEAGLPQGDKRYENNYQSADGQVTYTVQQISPTQRNLRITFAGIADDITVRNWQPGQLGIDLDDNLPAIVPNYVDSGDDQGAADDRLTAFYDPDGAGPLQGSYVSDVHLAGGNGSDTVLGYTGRDLLEGGVGSDIVLGEASVIVGSAPPAGDPGDDRLYGDAEIDMALAIVQGNAQTGSALKGDWLGGQDGDDALAGSTADDVLMGGRGADLLVAGAGDDELNGDDDYAPGTAAPWSVSEMPGNEFDRLYTPVISYNRADDLGAGDILYGGAGNDHLLGLNGDDVLYGENDNDTLAGGDDDDVLLGGDGTDRLSGDFGQSTTCSGRVVVQGDDWLDGGAGNDFAQGEGGDDQLFGGAGDDELWGDAKTYTDASLNGDDQLDGGDGNDDLIGQGGADALFGGTGNDSLFGDADDTAVVDQGGDYLDGESGDDYLRGYGGADELWGGDGADELQGDAGADQLAGDAGADTLSGGDGDDVLTGGAGLDVPLGAAGDDTYVFDLGDGANGVQIEAIDDSAGRNTVVFADAQTSTVTVQDDGAGNLIIDYSANDRVAVVGGAAGSVASYAFAAGQSYTTGQLVGRFSSGPVSTLDAQGRPIELGGSGADALAATAAYATLSGGLGNDTLSGSGGHNTYLYSLGDGADRIVDTSAKTDAQGQPAPNRIVFAAGIAPADISLGHAAGDLVLTVGPSGGGDTLGVAGFDAANALGTPAIDSFEFDDGTVLGYSELLARGFDLVGTAGNDVLPGTSVADRFDGGAGDDTLRGGLGDDTYSLGVGSGFDLVDDADVAAASTDTLRITGASTPADLQLLRRGDDLWVSLRSSPDRTTVVNHFAGAGVEQIAFADGTLWDTAAIAAHVTNELTDGANVFTGTAGDDAIDARGGNDLVDALAGADVVDGGAGDDTLNGGDGSDALAGGTGNDSLVGGQGADLYRFGSGGGADAIDDRGTDGALDTLRLDAGITPQGVTLSGSAQITLSLVGTGDSIRFAGPDAAGAGKIERIEFGDGTVWSEAQWAQRALDDTGATAGADSITGFAATNDTLRGLDGSDTLAGLAGNDQLDGGAGSDSLDGGDGDDLLIDGETMNGGAGNDTYRVDTWTPYVTRIVIRDVPDVEGNVDALVLPPQVSPAALEARPGGAGPYEDLVLSERATDNSITVRLFFNSQGSDYKIEQIRFADGTVWSVADVFAKVAQAQMTAGNDTVLGYRWGEVLDAQAGNDLLIGHWGDDQLFGGAGDDSMFGDAYDTFYTSPLDGGDTLDGGAGNDTIYGGGGDDAYLFGRGRGSDSVFELGGNDRIELGADVLPADVDLFRVGTTLVLAIDQGPTQLQVGGQFSGTAGQAIESIRFADGTVWDAAQIQVLAAGGTPNAMTGTAGDDTFVVDDPADTISEAANQGVDTVQSSVGFGLGANLENLTLTGYLNVFGTGNALNNVITGNAGSNTLRGSGAGVGGRDTFVGGAGDDTYYVDGATGSFGGDVNSDDAVTEAVDQGIDTVVTNTLTYVLPANVENLRSTITTSAASLVGNGLDNVTGGQPRQQRGRHLGWRRGRRHPARHAGQ